MNLLDLLKQRYTIAEKFTSDFEQRVKNDIEAYKGKVPELFHFSDEDKMIVLMNRRYRFQSPLVFTNHEAMLASMFDRPPEIVVSQKGEDDLEKAELIKAAYKYLVDNVETACRPRALRTIDLT